MKRLLSFICWMRGYHGTRQPLFEVPFCETCGICLDFEYGYVPSTGEKGTQ